MISWLFQFHILDGIVCNINDKEAVMLLINQSKIEPINEDNYEL